MIGFEHGALEHHGESLFAASMNLSSRALHHDADPVFGMRQWRF
jgi:hypothetical protein